METFLAEVSGYRLFAGDGSRKGRKSLAEDAKESCFADLAYPLRPLREILNTMVSQKVQRGCSWIQSLQIPNHCLYFLFAGLIAEIILLIASGKSHFIVILLAKLKSKTYFCLENHIIMSIKQLGETIKNRRKELSITQPHLAELAKVSTNTLYKLERGQGNPSFEVLNKLAEVLGMEIMLEVKNLSR